MRQPDTLGQAIKRAWKPPPARFANWLDKLEKDARRIQPRSKAAERQRRHDARMVKRMRKAIAKHNRDVSRMARLGATA